MISFPALHVFSLAVNSCQPSFPINSSMKFMREVFPFHFMCRKTSGRPALFSHLCLEGVSHSMGLLVLGSRGSPVIAIQIIESNHAIGSSLCTRLVDRDTLNEMFGCTPLYPPGPGSFDPRGIQHLTSLLPWRKLSSFRFSQGF